MKKLLLAIAFILICSNCLGAGNTPERIVEYYDYDVSTVDGTNTFADDGTYTPFVATGNLLVAYWNQIYIPYQAKVTGVVIKLEQTDSDHCTTWVKPPAQSVYITFDGGTTWSAAKTFQPAINSPTVFTFGSSGDLWGLGSPGARIFQDINSLLDPPPSSFRVKIVATLGGTTVCDFGYSQELWIDYVSAIVYYTMPDSPQIFKQERKGIIQGGRS